MVGELKKDSRFCVDSLGLGKKWVSTVVIISKNTGNVAVRKLLSFPGSLKAESTFLAANTSTGPVFIFFRVLLNKGPATRIAGIQANRPKIYVIPILALNIVTNATGDGWGGRKPCATDKAANMGIPIYIAGILYWLTIEKIIGTRMTKPIS